MNILKIIENRLEKLFDEFFQKTEKCSAQPIEMALGIVKEMKRKAIDGIKKTYSPNIFTISLNSEDYEKISAFKNTLKIELIEYISQYAVENNLHFIGRPEITLVSDENTAKGKIGVKAEMIEQPVSLYSTISEEKKVNGVSCEKTGKIKVKSTPILIEITDSNKPTYPVYQKTSVGRSAECDVVIDDTGVSRHHLLITAEDGESFSIEDLGSTNGTFLNDKKILQSKLQDGDEVLIGKTKLLFRTFGNQDEAS